MWDDAQYWLPQVLAGETLEAEIVFAADCEKVRQGQLGSDASPFLTGGRP